MSLLKNIAASRTGQYLRAMGKAQQFISRVNYEEFNPCVLDLTQRNAFRAPDEARLVWQT